MEETSSGAVEHSLRLREARAVGVKCVGRQNASHQLELELLEGHSDLADTGLPNACVNASHTDIQNTPHRSRSSSLSTIYSFENKFQVRFGRELAGT
jgi:hypothetical protein